MAISSISSLDAVLGAAGLFICIAFLKRKSGSQSSIPLPPGPKGLPVLGNVADMPTEEEWKTFSQWGKKYGGICSVNLMGQPIMVVNTPEILDELDQKGASFSGRPYLLMGGELSGYAKTLVLAPYTQRWRNYRRFVGRLIGTPAANAQFSGIEEFETHRFLQRILKNPSELSKNVRKTSGAIILKLTYGISIQEPKDPFVDLIEHANDNFNIACKPGYWLVDVFPWLMSVPESLMIGGGFKSAARQFAKGFNDMVEVPYNFVRKQMAEQIAPKSFVSALLDDGTGKENSKLSEDEIFEIKHSAASLYGGGADTSASAEYAFFLAMTLFPEVQKKAQAEIDSVVHGRLPTLADKPNLPYVNALVTEVLRWNSVAPTGVPHLAVEDGTVGGYYIPKGSLIISNLWQILHDEKTYPDPFVFDPERHISTPEKPAQRDPRFACFGWGRRVCPGMHLAEATVFLMIAGTLATFDINKAVENGKVIVPVHENTSTVISHPKPFKCAITPRSEQAVAIISHLDEY